MDGGRILADKDVEDYESSTGDGNNEGLRELNESDIKDDC